MLHKLTDGNFGFHSDALVLRAERQRILASNIANADTPGFVARDFHFASTLRAATEKPNADLHALVRAASTTHERHMPIPTVAFGNRGKRLAYSLTSMPSLDNNTVDMDRERANFADNSVRYEATLRFLNGTNRTMISAITGQ